MDRKHIAAQLFTVREYLKTPADIRAALQKVGKLGYQAVQVSAMGPIDPALLKDYADEAGLAICATHIRYDRLINDLPAVISEHKTWGCDYVGLGMMPEKFRSSREGFLAFSGEMNEIAKKLQDNGLKFIYHNHKLEFEKFDGVTGMELLLDNTDPAAFGFELDTYWVQAGGADPVEWIRKVAGRMEVVHFKDMAIVGDQQVYAEIGEGNLNWQAIIRACRETNVRWYAVEQDICRRDPFDSLDMSLRYLERFC